MERDHTVLGLWQMVTPITGHPHHRITPDFFLFPLSLSPSLSQRPLQGPKHWGVVGQQQNVPVV